MNIFCFLDIKLENSFKYVAAALTASADAKKEIKFSPKILWK